MALGEGEGIGGDDTGVGFDDFGGADFDFSVDDLFDDVGNDPRGIGFDIGSVFDDPVSDVSFDIDEFDTEFDFSFESVEDSLFEGLDISSELQFESLTFSDDVALFVRENPTLTNIGLGILTAVNPALGFAARTAKSSISDFGVTAPEVIASKAVDIAIDTLLSPISTALGRTVGGVVGGLPGAITAGVVSKGVKGFASKAVRDEISTFRSKSPEEVVGLGGPKDPEEVRSLLDPEAGPIDIPPVRSPERFKEFFGNRRLRRPFA